jgi:hypothetical protein
MPQNFLGSKHAQVVSVLPKTFPIKSISIFKSSPTALHSRARAKPTEVFPGNTRLICILFQTSEHFHSISISSPHLRLLH